MSDNITLNPGFGGDIAATDEVNGVHYQKVKIAVGDTDEATLVTSGSLFPVSGSVGVTAVSPLPVSGSVGVTANEILPITGSVTTELAGISTANPLDVAVMHGLEGTSSLVSTYNPLPVNLPDDRKDAFARLRVSDVFILGDIKHTSHEHEYYNWNNTFIAGATGSWAEASASMVLSTTTSSGSRAIRESRKRFRYQAGKSMFVGMTGQFGPAQSDLIQRIGYFDSNNGLFFEISGSTKNIVRRSSGVDTRVAQANWSFDKLDGTGYSGVTIDWTKSQIFVIDFQWLGVGRVRFGHYVAGRLIYFHEIDHANLLASAFMATPNLPVRYELINYGNLASAGQMQAICISVQAEGGTNLPGLTRTVGTGLTPKTVNTSYVPLVGVRLKANENNQQVSDVRAAVVCSSNNVVWEWALVYNPTVTSPTWISLEDSIVQYDTGSTAAITGGRILASGFGFGKAEISADVLKENSTLSLSADANGVRDTLYLCGRAVSGASLFGSITFSEKI